jgi:hypothetical protein
MKNHSFKLGNLSTIFMLIIITFQLTLLTLPLQSQALTLEIIEDEIYFSTGGFFEQNGWEFGSSFRTDGDGLYGYTTSTSSPGEYCLVQNVIQPFGYENDDYISDFSADNSCEINPYNESGKSVIAMNRWCGYDTEIFQYPAGSELNDTSVDITMVNVVLGIYMQNTFADGWLSFIVNGSGWFIDTWLMYPQIFDNIVSGAGETWGDMHNSSYIPLFTEGTWPYVYAASYFRWDITDLYAWNYSTLMSDDLYLIWTGNQDAGDSQLIYLGIYWEFGGIGTISDYYSGAGDDEEYYDTPEITSGMNITGVIWLLVAFFPAIAIGQYIPKIGMIAGLTIMLIVLGITQAGFFPISVIGFIGIAIYIYKTGG